MSAKRIQLRGSDCGSAFIAATARRIAARSGSLADMPRTERRVTPAPCANGALLPTNASDEPAAARNARLCNMKGPIPLTKKRYRMGGGKPIAPPSLFPRLVIASG